MDKLQKKVISLKNSEKKIKEFNKKLREIADLMPDGCMLVNVQEGYPVSYVTKNINIYFANGALNKVQADLLGLEAQIEKNPNN